MATLLLLSKHATTASDVLPSLALLHHKVQVVPAEASSLLEAPRADAILLDARTDLAAARALCRIIQTTGGETPVVIVVTEGGLTALASDWGFTDLVVDSAGPAEVEARLRLATTPADDDRDVIASGGIVIDEAGYAARLNGRQLDLTYTEFELLKYLVQHPGRVFSREQLLSDVWGYDYYGGTRTVDVHVRRLRAKLGPEHESIIGTVRNVGYRLVVKS
ncbi:DNA-binding response regulator [Auraticoccus sp. F435]|uniref:DNA-binding response regulator n=1 Tax=Auraticoccus cholistanensis TaxID=2656650 RepID=A0A6A9V273_9ACTN|nr:response regulator transcription factor [Auraticoccus cholistanensis]MVA77736.1 DNA-binding response regulator [Auraticoccus cholistanensis]